VEEKVSTISSLELLSTPNKKPAPGALHLQVISFNCYSTFFNPPSRYYQRTAIPSTMLSPMSSFANTYRALVTLCTNRRVTRLLKTVSPTHITLGECTISAYQQDRFQTRPQVIGRSRLMSSERKPCLHTTNRGAQTAVIFVSTFLRLRLVSAANDLQISINSQLEFRISNSKTPV
jgi:hypothetical protein